MSGICGILHLDEKKRPMDDAVLRRMLASMTWREGDRWRNGRIALAGSCSSLGRPLTRLALDADGIDSPTRAEIADGYRQHGDDFVRHLRGPFALALWDEEERQLILARDRVGVRRLYYARHEGALVFASELRAILRVPRLSPRIDPVSLDRFLTYEFMPGPRTILRSVRQLAPGHILCCRNGALSQERYWRLSLGETKPVETPGAAGLSNALRKSVEAMVGRRDVTVLLSGGIDSSALVALAKEAGARVRTLTVGFRERSYDERPYGRLVARHFGTAHAALVAPPPTPASAEKLIGLLDQPFADSSVFPTDLAYEAAMQRPGIVLTGDGGDELFAGYDALVAQRLDDRWRSVPALLRTCWLPRLAGALQSMPGKRGPINTAVRFLQGASLDARLGHMRWRSVLTPECKARLYSDDLKEQLAADDAPLPFDNDRPGIDDMLLADFETYLPDYTLAKVDLIGAAHRLRPAMPFLDPGVVEAATGIPAGLKLNGFRRKHVLKEALTGHIPGRVLKRRKEGFSGPMKHWLRGELKPLMLEVLSAERIEARGLVRYECVKRMIGEHVACRRDHSHRLWALMVLHRWCETNLP